MQEIAMRAVELDEVEAGRQRAPGRGLERGHDLADQGRSIHHHC
jgi:hypothetical protein